MELIVSLIPPCDFQGSLFINPHFTKQEIQTLVGRPPSLPLGIQTVRDRAPGMLSLRGGASCLCSLSRVAIVCHLPASVSEAIGLLPSEHHVWGLVRPCCGLVTRVLFLLSKRCLEM